MCYGRELDQDARRDQEQVLDEIRRLFARYRRVGREPPAAERDEAPEAPAEEPEETHVLVGR